MKLLLDQNLSRNLVVRLHDAFPESQHVSAVGLDIATDREIWNYAHEHDFMIASKDSDFRQLAFLNGPPPKVLWLRVGDASTAAILEMFLDHVEAINAFAVTEDEALLVVPDLARRQGD